MARGPVRTWTPEPPWLTKAYKRQKQRQVLVDAYIKAGNALRNGKEMQWPYYDWAPFCNAVDALAAFDAPEEEHA